MIFLSGGGTLGSVTPLLAVGSEIKKQKPEIGLLWIGTKNGIEQGIIGKNNIAFKSIFSGKLRRYLSLRNFTDLFLIVLGVAQSIFLILKFRPKAILSAGGFVSVPLVWAGWLLGVPCLIHQQDIRPGLANRLMQPFAKRITVAFEESLKLFPKNKTIYTGNPVRPEIFEGDKKQAIKLFNLEEGMPTLLVVGGGTGALFLNKLIAEALPELIKFCQVVHSTGKDKCQISDTKCQTSNHYHSSEFLMGQIKHALAVADLVVTRAGLGILSELAVLGKPAIIIPMYGTHQEENAQYFAKKGAAIVFSEADLNSEIFVQKIKKLLQDSRKLEELSQKIKAIMKPDAASKIAEEVTRFFSDN